MNYNYNNIYSANEIRFNSIECRLENVEKLIKFYDNLINLKHEERTNDFNLVINEGFTDINQKIAMIDNKINVIIKSQKKEIDNLNLQIEKLNGKIDQYKYIFDEQKNMQENTKKLISEKLRAT